MYHADYDLSAELQRFAISRLLVKFYAVISAKTEECKTDTGAAKISGFQELPKENEAALLAAVDKQPVATAMHMLVGLLRIMSFDDRRRTICEHMPVVSTHGTSVRTSCGISITAC